MDLEQVGGWLEGYRRAWERADTSAVPGLFTADATYRAHPLRPAYDGHQGIGDYWARATADQRDVRVRFGDPIVDGDRVAAEWWTVLRAGGDPVTLTGCLLLRFAADGRCQALRECWHETGELVDPPAGWGRLDPPAGPVPGVRPVGQSRAQGGPAAGPAPPADPASTDPAPTGPLPPAVRTPTDPGAGDRARGHARGWAEGYERAWRAGDPEAAAALYAPDVNYRSAPFRDPHLGREGVLAYTRDAYATEAEQEPRFGTPFAAGASAAVEWWATTLEEEQPATLIGTSFLTFTPDGLVAVGRDYWFLEPGFHLPYDGWGR